MRIASIDQGTTSTRVLVLENNGQLNIACSLAHKQFYPHEGWVEHDPEELITNIRRCADAAGDVAAIGLDNQGESCLAWDSVSKQALSPVIVWQDNRTIEHIEQLRSDGVECETLKRSGLPLDPYFSASKLGWIVKNIPAAKAAYSSGTLRLGTTDAFFLDRLTNRFATDISTASRTSLLNLTSLDWDEHLCEIFEVPMECLPKIMATTGDFGVLETAHHHIPITASVVDQQAALYGFGCRKKGDAKITFGTGAFALALTGGEVINKPDSGLLPTVAWQLEDQAPVYALDGGVYTASASVNWAKSLGLFTDFNQINAFATPPAFECGLVFVPALAGLGSPHWQPRARGAWLGLSLEHHSLQLVQAILEGVAYRASEVIESITASISASNATTKGKITDSVDALLIDGGMSNNPYFVQFLANLTQREIRVSHMPDVTAIGALKLASRALGKEVTPNADFTRVLPDSGADISTERFKQAIAVSRNWQ